MGSEQPGGERRRRAMLTAALLGLVALGFYLGFILVNMAK